MSIAAPSHWGEASSFRACALCQHSRARGNDRVCVCPEVTGRKPPAPDVPADWPFGMPVAAARAVTGPCGPEADRLAFPGLR